MKKMTLVLKVAFVMAAMFFLGCKPSKGQIPEGPEMVRDTTDEPVDGRNKEAVLDGPDGTSTQAFTGNKDNVEVAPTDIEEMPKTAVRQQDSYMQYAVYINEEKPESAEGAMDAVKSVWLADERTGTVVKVCVTNPNAEAQWNKMSGKGANAVSVPLTQIAAADKAMIAPGDVSKVIVEGCPDGRNVWTYIIDPYEGTARQLPSTEGVVSLDWEKKEIIVAAYGYDDVGRYSVSKAISLDGMFLRQVGEKERE